MLVVPRFSLFSIIYFFQFLITLYNILVVVYQYLYVFPLSPIPYLPSSALEEILDRPIEIYSSDAEELVPMKIDFDSAAVSQPPYEKLHQSYRCFYSLL